MKKTIIILAAILVTLFSCSNSGHKKSEPEVKKTRYFFVGYNIISGEQTSLGNFGFWSETYPVLDSLKLQIFNFSKCDFQNPLKVNECAVTGFYEFRTADEFWTFYGDRSKKMTPCDSLTKK